MELQIYETKEAVAHNFSAFLKTFIEPRPIVHIALSGGSTPKIVFDALAADYKDSIDWTKVHFYWGDERCVPPTDDESNFKMTQRHLFSKIDVPTENIHRIQGENDPEIEAIAYDGLLQRQLPVVDGIPRFDLIILGLGDDGHTASIFPNNIDLWFSDRNCEVALHPDSGQLRITLTGKVINNAETVVFLVTGLGKSEKVKEIVEQTGKYESYPATLVKPYSKHLIWFLDKEAACQLT
jgi:6-phosphogluconolactonase